MFLFWIKPKRMKKNDNIEDYFFAHDLHTPFFIAQMLLTIMWIACIPFIFIAFTETVHVFITVTILLLVANLITKLLHPTYIYF